MKNRIMNRNDCKKVVKQNSRILTTRRVSSTSPVHLSILYIQSSSLSTSNEIRPKKMLMEEHNYDINGVARIWC